MQLRARHIARSVLSNWFAIAAGMAVGFFLSPFLVHRLGNVAYGVWVLAISSVSYFGLLDLGLRNSVTMFVAKGHTTGDHEAASQVLSAALWVRIQIAALVMVLCGVLVVVFPVIFKITPAMATDARVVVLLMGLNFAIYMSIGVFGGILSALNRYDLYTLVVLTQLTLRVIGVVTVVRAGYGIVAIAWCELAAGTVGYILFAYVARRIYPELKIRLKKPSGEVLKRIWSYSAYVFLLMVAIQLVYQTDNLVVGAFVSASAVTFYSIGNSLCRYTQQLVGAMTATFTPAASTFDAAGDTSSLRALYYNGTRATMAVSLPILITLIFRGDNFIGVWMGPQYSRTSGTVLAILATALLFSLQNTPATSIAFGIEKHKTIAMWAIAEAIANLTLSIVLARNIGIYGVAIGTLVPSLAVNLLLWPRYVSHLVGINYREVFLKVWGPVFLCAVPFAGASYAVGAFFPARNLMMFILQTVALLPIFAVSVGWIFRNNLKRRILPQIKSYFHAEAR
ncbi:MAG: oligosaccharide flippase family protein [Terracidiphilus sp.]